MGVVPAADQQDRLAQQRRGDRMPPPAQLLSRIPLQPAQGHAPGIVLGQQGHPLPQEGLAFEAAANLAPGLFIPASAALQRRQLQTPSQAQGPPVGTPLAGPVIAFTGPGHGRGQAIRQGGGIALGGGIEQLAEALIRKAITAQPAIGPGQTPGPAHRLGAIGRLLVKATEMALRIPLAAHVLHHHHKSLGRVPAGMGVGDRRGDRPAVGLAHQQHGPAAWAPRSPQPTGQAGAVATGHPEVLLADGHGGGRHSITGDRLQADSARIRVQRTSGQCRPTT